jgi:hypothetical protein
MRDLRLCVELHRSTVETSPVAYIYPKALREVSEKNTLSQFVEKSFYLIGDSLVYHDRRYGQAALFTLSDNANIADQTMKRIQDSLTHVFTKDTSFDYESSSSEKSPVPLSEKGYYQEPKFERSFPKNPNEMEFMQFLELVGGLCPTTNERFNLVEAIEEQFLPQRLLRIIR